MTSRNLTSKFLEFRNRVLRDRNFHGDEKSNDDRTALLEDQDDDVHFERNIPPSWVTSQRQIQLQLDQVRSQMKKLQQLHDKHLTRPDFDENLSEQKEIETITKAITTILNECHTSVQRLSVQAGKLHKNIYDQRLSSNIVQASATALQDLTMKFRKGQSTYLLKLKSWKDDFKPLLPETSYQDDGNKNLAEISLTSEDQLQLTTENIEYLDKRDKEIREVLKSMEEVNQIFHDVGVLISTQGTALDQIEYNIENTIVQVELGGKELTKAVESQQRRLKFKLIVFGIGLFVLSFIILVAAITR